MHIDPRLNDIDDCLYRVAIRALIIQDNKVLLVKEFDDNWWALPGGGVDHGETVESTLVREVEEELGVPATSVGVFQNLLFTSGLGLTVRFVCIINDIRFCFSYQKGPFPMYHQ